jgi:LPXTG-motif cell wall-anchored protein
MDPAQQDQADPSVEAPDQAPPINQSRRRFVAGAVAAATGVVAAGYVKPSIQPLGVPAALAAVSPFVTATPTRPKFDNENEGNDNQPNENQPNENEGNENQPNENQPNENDDGGDNDGDDGGDNDDDGGDDNDGDGDGGGNFNDSDVTVREGGVPGVVERPGVPTPTRGPVAGVAGVVERPQPAPAAAPGQIPLPAVLPQAGESSFAATVAGVAGVGLAALGMLTRRRRRTAEAAAEDPAPGLTAPGERDSSPE